MRGREIHIRIDPAIYEQAKQARKAGKLRGSLGQIVTRAIVSELEKLEPEKPEPVTVEPESAAREASPTPSEN